MNTGAPLEEHVLGMETFWGETFHTRDVDPTRGTGQRHQVWSSWAAGPPTMKFANNEPARHSSRLRRYTSQRGHCAGDGVCSTRRAQSQDIDERRERRFAAARVQFSRRRGDYERTCHARSCLRRRNRHHDEDSKRGELRDPLDGDKPPRFTCCRFSSRSRRVAYHDVSRGRSF